MNKEKVFSELQDIVKTLFSPNINNAEVKAKWDIKAKDLADNVKELNSCDSLWLSEEYAKWYEINIKPNINGDISQHKDVNFPWI